MPVPPDVAAYFTAPVRARGEAYQREGRVRLLDAGPAHAEAIVRGSRAYRVRVAIEDGRIVAECTCPYASDWDAGCKHAWATLLEAAWAGHRMEAPVRRTVARRRDGAEDDLSDGRTTHVPRWRRELDRLKAERAAASPFGDRGPAPVAPLPPTWPADRRIAYVLEAATGNVRTGDGVVVELATQRRQPLAAWGPPVRFAYTQAQWMAAPDAVDREVAQMLLGAREEQPWQRGLDQRESAKSGRRFRIAAAAYETTLRRICATGRAFVRYAGARGDVLAHLAWDDGPAWQVALALVPHGEHRLKLEAALVRPAGGDVPDEQRLPIGEVRLLAEGLAIVADPDNPADCLAARADDEGARPLLAALAEGRVIAAADTEALALVAEVAALYPRLAPVALPPSLGVEVLHVAPVPRLALSMPARGPRGTHGVHVPLEPRHAEARLAFAYGDTVVDAGTPGSVIEQPARHRLVTRDRAAEEQAARWLEELGARAQPGGGTFRLTPDRVGRIAVAVTAEGWHVTIDDHALRRAGETSATVRSGVDWFDLDAAVDFGGMRVGLPALLAAVRRGDRTVSLPDGSLGVLPDEWVARWGRLAVVGAPTEQGVRFAQGQAALLDALLATMPAADVDAQFERARAALRRFEGFHPADAPPGFQGTLRDYQRDGLGWLQALRDVGIGGILADDMGLGKTVQVLALLERLRQDGAGPSLVVVPASIVFNWVQEAARFAPALRVHVHHGAARRESVPALGEVDLVVTTYGTLRRDAAEFRDVEFEYVILDEAQAIKNATTATAKAARLLRARHRLAVTGTPVENRLAELWSLFEFLAPGMLGASSAFRRLTSDGAVSADEVATMEGAASDGVTLVAQAVRPYILRRTKGQVARELPERVEQTVWVDLAPDERKLYDELRDHYRASILGRVESAGLAKSKIHVLEALLRLRQAACHPGLIDKARAGDGSGKLDVLLTRLAETAAEGHKTLVFSQFTTLLGIVRDRLDAAGVTYEYLDGRTRDRQARVERFQGDPSVTVFLISLKAGGLGLNLTAADYVFLLDPWWNPAVEAQAIDRAHRIGQSRRVIATRLVARDTVEEKVLLLQEGKRALADAIVRADDGLLRTLTREDLELLLT